MGCGCSSAKVADVMADRAARLGEFVHDTKEAWADNYAAIGRLTREEELQAKIDALKLLSDHVKAASRMYRDWARHTSDVLYLPSLSLWAQQPNFVGAHPAEANPCLLYTSPSPRDRG